MPADKTNGLTLYQRLVIRVGRKHIIDGAIGNMRRCPIALALADRGIDARVGSNTIAIGKSISQLPLRSRRWLLDYDLGKPVSPFRFNLDIFMIDRPKRDRAVDDAKLRRLAPRGR